MRSIRRSTRSRSTTRATDFAPVALIADAALVLITRKDLAADNLQDFIAYAKANQGKMQFGSGGTGTSSHIGCVLLNQALRRRHHPRSLSRRRAGLADLIAGRVDYICNIASTVGPAIEAKQVKPIATLTPRALADPARSADRARAGPQGFRRLYLERGVPAQGHAGGARRQAQRRAAQGDGQCGLPRSPAQHSA